MSTYPCTIDLQDGTVAKTGEITYIDATDQPAVGGGAQAAIDLVATTGPTDTSPYGYTTSAQAAYIVTAINDIISALTAAGILAS